MMIKIIFLAFLSTIVVAEDGNDKLYSLHAPENMKGSLNLTTGELKLFSGHAMNIIRSKCPSVDADKIFQVQKYMGKLIAKSDPVQGTSKNFKDLLQTMTTCAKEGVIPKATTPAPKQRTNIFRSLFFPSFHHMRNVFFEHHKLEQADVPVVAASGIDSGLIKSETNAEEKVKEAVSTTAAPQVPTQRIIKTTIFVRPQDMQEGIRSSGGFVNWIHNIFARIGGFFGNILPFGLIRKRRDISDFQPMESAYEPEFPTFQVYTPTKDESKGKKSFGKLIDQMCRLYCDTCTGEKEIIDRKSVV